MQATEIYAIIVCLVSYYIPHTISIRRVIRQIPSMGVVEQIPAGE